MFKKLFSAKILKFLLGGGVAAIFNLVLMFGLIEWLGFNTPVLRNVANILAIECSLLFSFFVYRFWVWSGGSWTIKELLFKQIPLYHVSAGTSVIARIFFVFPLLDWLQVNYAINTLIGIFISAALNYLISDRLVFKTSKSPSIKQKSEDSKTTIYHPEGLAPALENSFSSPKTTVGNYTSKINLLSIVIPAHNEEGCIVNTIDDLTQVLEVHNINYEILVVNDNSRDRTEQILQKLCEENNRINYINNYYPNGFGFAVRCGLENFQGGAVAIVMADNSDCPDNIVDYYHQLQQGYDCVFGSRFIRGGNIIDYPWHKLIINRLANLFIKILFGLKFNDTTNAFKMYRREVIEGINPLLSHHFNLTVEMPLKAIVRGYSYTIVPILWRNRTTGISKLKLKEMGSRYLFIVLYIWLEKHLSQGDYVRKQHQVIISTHRR